MLFDAAPVFPWGPLPNMTSERFNSEVRWTYIGLFILDWKKYTLSRVFSEADYVYPRFGNITKKTSGVHQESKVSKINAVTISWILLKSIVKGSLEV